MRFICGGGGLCRNHPMDDRALVVEPPKIGCRVALREPFDGRSRAAVPAGAKIVVDDPFCFFRQVTLHRSRVEQGKYTNLV